RVLVVDGEPVPYCLARIPQGGETRGNLAAGGRGEPRPLTESDWKIARQIGPHGNVVDFSCTVNTADKDKTVDLGRWPTTQLLNAGDTTAL
ncbi:hypothetical protein O5254_27055, partial [Escherichia coli]|nr:hypothetical protein [Escherichia coli]